MELTLFQVDAFTTKVFGGNPAAVCYLNKWPPDSLLQKIAFENNLSETAFFVRSSNPDYNYHIRWFTPTVEVDLCGHATLASAHCLFEELGFTDEEIRFESRSGLLMVRKSKYGYTLNFPSIPFTVSDSDVQRIESLLGLKVKTVLKSDDLYAVLDETSETVKNYVPNIAKIKNLEDTVLGLIITARGHGNTDFVSRLFAPQVGIDEDPVTGATHCVLAPYWAHVLGKTQMNAKQLSAREGDLHLELKGDRVHISGHAVCYLKGTIHV